MERSDSGRWDQSSIITVEVPLSTEPSDSEAFSPIFGEGQHNGVHYYADEEGLAYIYVYDTTHVEADAYSRGKLGYKFLLVCEPSGYVHASVVSAGDFLATAGTFIEVSYQIGDLPLAQDSWRAKNYQQLNSLYLETGDLRGQSQVRVWLPNTVRTFDISGLHETVMQPDIDNCREFSELTE